MNDADKILWTGAFFNERFPAPVSPLGWSLVGPLVEKVALRDPLRFLGYPLAETIPLSRLWRGHPYANVFAFQVFYKVFPDPLMPEDAYRYFPDGDVNMRKRAAYPHWTDLPRVTLSLLGAFLSDPFNVSPLTNHQYWARYTHEHDRRVAALRARMAEFAEAEPREIFAALCRAEHAHRDLLRIHRWSLVDADLTHGLLKSCVGAWGVLAEGFNSRRQEHVNEILGRLLANVPNKTLQVDTALRDLGSQPQSDGHRIMEFLAEHGHRSFSLDIAVPTFGDEPEQVTRLIQSIGERPEIPVESFSHFRIRSPFERAIFTIVLSLARHYIAMREDQRYYWQKSLAVSRHLYLLLADRLASEGVIADREMVFYATHRELVDYFQARESGVGDQADRLAGSISARRAEWDEYQREFERSPTESYPQFLDGDIPLGRRSANLSSSPAVSWTGRPVSPGIARGVARLVYAAGQLSRVGRGEILVAPATDPAWTPAFARIAGLVVERGGVLSHSAVVAREYHVPAVAGISNITAEIRDGELIEVNGSRGTVRRIR